MNEKEQLLSKQSKQLGMLINALGQETFGSALANITKIKTLLSDLISHGSTEYSSNEDEVGYCRYCSVESYSKHKDNCEFKRLEDLHKELSRHS